MEHEKPFLGPTYNRAVLIGNWFEDQCFAEEKVQEHLEKKNKGELYVQRRKRLFETVLQPMQISCNRDGVAHFGDVVVVQHPGFRYEVPQHAQLLAAGLGENPLVTVPTELPTDEVLTSTYDLNPTVRTTFVITGLNDKTPHGKPLTFGEPFQLKTTEGVGRSLRLYSIRRTFQEYSKRTDHQCVKLVEDESQYTSWCILTIDPQRRIESGGQKVPTNSRIVINHMFTNKHLALERTCPFQTFFGLEYEVTTHVYLDPYKWPTEANHWIIRQKAVEGTLSKTVEPPPQPAESPLPDECTIPPQPPSIQADNLSTRPKCTMVCPEKHLLCNYMK